MKKNIAIHHGQRYLQYNHTPTMKGVIEYIMKEMQIYSIIFD